MNYYDARQRQESKRWDYTVKMDGDIRPVGYCSGVHGDDEDHQDLYHEDGHATELEARLCYRRYLLDHRLNMSDGHGSSAALKCKVCESFTTGYAEIWFMLLPLCDEHRTAETVEALFSVPGYIVSSD